MAHGLETMVSMRRVREVAQAMADVSFELAAELLKDTKHTEWDCTQLASCLRNAMTETAKIICERKHFNQDGIFSTLQAPIVTEQERQAAAQPIRDRIAKHYDTVDEGKYEPPQSEVVLTGPG